MMTRRLLAPLLCLAAALLVAPTAHADAGTIAYVGADGIHLINPDGTGDRRLIAGTDPSFSADGRTVVFSRWTSGIYAIGVDGHHLRRLVRGSRNRQPALSPDGRRVAFQHLSGRGGGRRAHGLGLYVKPLHGRVRRVGHGSGDGEHPVFSPDGRHLLFDVAGVDTGLYRTDARGRHQHRLAVGAHIDDPVQPDYSPDGRHVVFADANTGVLWTVSAHGGQRRRLATPPLSQIPNQSYVWSDPAFSPDGGTIVAAFSRVYDYPWGLTVIGSGELDLLPISGGAPVKLLTSDDVAADWGR
jgi:Tol biopolymer transport system component